MFPELEVRYGNLLYAGASCNRFKGDYWSDEEELQVLNPCEQVMSQHLGFDKEVILNRSKRGEFNIELLRLNNQNSVGYRTLANEHVLLLIQGILEQKKLKSTVAKSWIERAVKLLSRLTEHDEEKIRRVLAV